MTYTRRFEGGRPARTKKSSSSSSSEKEDKKQSTTTIRKGGETTVIVRRSAAEGGTYSYKVKDGQAVSGSFRGGSNVKSQRESTKRSVGLSKESSQTTTQSREVVESLQSTSGIPQNSPESVEAQMVERPAVFNPLTGEYTPQAGTVPQYSQQQTATPQTPPPKPYEDEAFYEVSYANGGGAIVSGKQLNVQATSPFLKPKLGVPDKKFVASSAEGGYITRSQAKAQQQRANRTTALDKGFYTWKGQKEAASRVGTQFKVLGQKTANLFLPKNKEFILSSEYATTAEKLTTNPIAVATAPAAYAVAATSVPIAATVVKGGSAGAAVGFTSTYGIQKGSEAIYANELKFAKENPELFEAARKYARQQTSEDTGAVTSFFNLDVTIGGKQKFIDAGTEYLESTGLSGKKLDEARLALAAQSGTEQASEVSFLLTAEAAGEGLGKFSGTGTIVRSGAKILIPENVVTTKTGKKVINKITLPDKETVVRSVGGGAGEGGSAVTSQQYIEQRKVDPVNVALGVGTGAITAGTFEFIRTAPSTTPKGKAITTTIGNVVEPQEFVVDQSLNIYEKILRKTSKQNTDLLKDFDIIRKGVNDFDVRPKTITSSSSGGSSNRVRTTSPADTLSFNKVDLVGKDFVPKPNSQTDSIIKINTDSKTTSQTTTQFLESSFTDTLVKTQTKANIPSLITSQTNTRVFTPTTPVPPVLPFGFGQSLFKKKSRSKTKQPTRYTPSAYSILTNTRAKKKKGRSLKGLGIRPILNEPRRKKKNKLFQF